MKLIHPKFAANACLLAMLAAPVAVLANPSDRGGKDRKRYSVPEPSTLAMTAVGVGLGIGLVLVGLRRSRRNVAA